MSELLDEQYITWLYRQIASVKFKNPSRTYWSLARHLYTKEYIWLVPNDDNRMEDGRDLRYEFMDECNVEPDSEWMSLGCSMLEMLLGLSRRLTFEAEGEPRGWFWELIENLDLKRYSDAYYDEENQSQIDEVELILDNVIWRTFESNGRGGLFPLKTPPEDQRDIEIWYQLSCYLAERN